jgi:hypothetical protein
MTNHAEKRRPSRISGFVCASVLVLHLAGGVVALALLPRGFAPDDIHLWSNTIIPATASVAVVVGLIHALIRRSAMALGVLVATAAGGWVSAVVVGAIMFPVSMTFPRLAVPALIAALLLALAWWSTTHAARSLATLVIGAGLGVVVIVAQRAPLPSTHPIGGTLLDVPGADGPIGDVVAPCGRRQIRVNPLLTFLSRSPDRTWTILSPDPPGSRRRQTGYRETTAGVQAAFVDDGQSTLATLRDADGLGVDIEAISKLPDPVYSHLNTFTSIEVPFDATVSFGPTGALRFPIEPADYPSGRPIKLAYVDAQLGFHVVRARDAEKGPFAELAGGRLGRGETLTLEVRPRDDSDAGCRIIFQDWSSQVSTEPSPTAGWGIPQGSIQFFSGLVLLTLADTGPGRGFDSVGHAAGTYRNRVRIEPIR